VKFLSGSSALGSMQEGLREAKADLETTGARLRTASESLAELQREEGGIYRELAGLRLDEMVRDQVVGDLDAAERRALDLLDEHRAQIEAIDQELAGREGDRGTRNKERAALVTRLDKLALQIDEAEAKVQARLAKDPDFAAQLEQAEQAEAVYKRAQRKADQAMEDRLEKGKPFEDEALFMYLWARGYGTSEYSAWPVIRWLDRKVAEICRFERLRPNYSMLLRLPEKLSEHADDKRVAAEAETARLEEMERGAMETDGVAAQAQDFDVLEAELAALDEAMARDEKADAGLHERRAALLSGESDSYRKALDLLTSAYRQESIRALYRDASATPLPDDDFVVEKLDDLTERRDDLEREIEHLRAMQQTQVRRVSELEEVIGTFRRRRFDSRNSEFSDPSMLTMVLGQFLKGALSSRGLWDALRRAQRFNKHRADPGFGSGGLRSPTGGRVKFPGPLGPIGGGFGGGRRSGGGGFRTGGSF